MYYKLRNYYKVQRNNADYLLENLSPEDHENVVD